MAADDLRLVIIMRDDLPSLNPGKACAQAAHAANQMVDEGRTGALEMRDTAVGVTVERAINEWEAQTGKGFGTTIVLSGNEMQMRMAVSGAHYQSIYFGKGGLPLAGVVHDPTYPTGRPLPNRLGTFLALSAIAVMLLALSHHWLALLFAFAGMMAVVADITARVRAAMQPPVIAVDTCAYLFGTKQQLEPITRQMNLRLMP